MSRLLGFFRYDRPVSTLSRRAHFQRPDLTQIRSIHHAEGGLADWDGESLSSRSTFGALGNGRGHAHVVSMSG
jgi:hypothetical protein